ncbi:MAG TPA: hypothetical protein VGO04_25810 [Ensifer sp.]|jgi:hypothetical protein|uniref:hypothetical protein n=1 Tax=Ensifer sp. TaxID=1872086 RepID=UPI002E0EABB5|nr:hypothetical protein [Ensifer sp.]
MTPCAADHTLTIVDLRLDPFELNEQLFAIGIWFIERGMPLPAKVSMEPERGFVRVSFLDAPTARAFRERFSQPQH